MVKFRCKRSGNTVSFNKEEEIKLMRMEQGYEEVIDVLQEEIKEAAEEIKPEIIGIPAKKKPGRPKKK